jgi:hypothetical protein
MYVRFPGRGRRTNLAATVRLMEGLPTELLVDIFTWCTHSSALTVVTLTEVCRRWRAIIRSFPTALPVHCLGRSFSTLQSRQPHRQPIPCA